MRLISGLPTTINTFRLFPALRWYVNRLEQSANFNIRFIAAPSGHAIPTGGTIEIKSMPARGTEVRACFPLLKNAGIEELELAIKSVTCGEVYLSPKVSRQVLDNYLGRLGGKKGHDKAEPLICKRLTARQREILQLIAEGYTTKGIAGKLNVSVKTVDTHRTQLMDRLNIHDIAGLVRYAIRQGVVTPD